MFGLGKKKETQEQEFHLRKPQDDFHKSEHYGESESLTDKATKASASFGRKVVEVGDKVSAFTSKFKDPEQEKIKKDFEQKKREEFQKSFIRGVKRAGYKAGRNVGKQKNENILSNMGASGRQQFNKPIGQFEHLSSLIGSDLGGGFGLSKEKSNPSNLESLINSEFSPTKRRK